MGRMTRSKHAAKAVGRDVRPRRRIVYDAVTFSEHDGVRYLHFGTEWIQGAMSLRRPYQIVLEYAQQMMAWMLFIAPPEEVLQLGLGTGALTKFCYRHFPDSRVTAVELNPAVIRAAHAVFHLPPCDERLNIVEADALDFLLDPLHHGRFGAVQVDLYDATAKGPVLDSVEFYDACRACLGSTGVLTVNLFGQHQSFERNIRSLKQVFTGRILALPNVHEGNRVVLAFKGPDIDIAFDDLLNIARDVRRRWSIPTGTWLEGIREAAGSRMRNGRFYL